MTLNVPVALHHLLTLRFHLDLKVVFKEHRVESIDHAADEAYWQTIGDSVTVAKEGLAISF